MSTDPDFFNIVLDELDEDDDDLFSPYDEEEVSDPGKVFIVAKTMLEGCSTLGEIADALTDMITWIDELQAVGYTLENAIENGWGVAIKE